MDQFDSSHRQAAGPGGPNAPGRPANTPGAAAPQGTGFGAAGTGPGAAFGAGYSAAGSGFGGVPPYGAGPGTPGGYLPYDVTRPRRRPARPLHLALLAVALAVVVLLALLLFTLASFGGTVNGLLAVPSVNNTPPAGSFSVVRVVGTIQSAGGDALGINEPSYHHADTVAHIQQLAETQDNRGILLYLNTPGGAVYESDEVYLALQAYKEATGRPVWAFMADTCASGGYYICAAADHIAANRNTITGSIGVYMALTDTSGLYEKLGIETVLVRSGPIKGSGMQGVPVTEEQRAVYQSVVDEMYQRFVQLVADGRGLLLIETRALADGRIYTAAQAQALGLIDEVSQWEDVLAAFEAETGGTAFYPNFSRATALGRMLRGIVAHLPQNETQTQLEAARQLPSGVPMAYYDPALATAP